MYTLYAYMRDEREIMIAEYKDVNLFLSILKNFEVSDHIDHFTIYENDKEYMTKVLRRRTNESIYQKRKIRGIQK